VPALPRSRWTCLEWIADLHEHGVGATVEMSMRQEFWHSNRNDLERFALPKADGDVGTACSK